MKQARISTAGGVSSSVPIEYASATKDFQDKLIAAVETFGTDEGFEILLDRTQRA